jgi:hypothetical protein
MYQFVSALAKTGAAGSRWRSVNLSAMVMSDIFGLYESIYVVLTNPLYTGQQSLDLNLIRSATEASGLTFNDYLTSLGDESLPTTTTVYSVTTKYAKYRNARRANYTIEPISPLGSIGSSILVQDRDWLSVTRADTDINLLFESALFTVNGFIHRSDSDGQRIYIEDGMKSARIADRTQLGITSFRELGSLEFVNITADMVHRRYPDTPMSSRMYIDVGQHHAGTPMLVLGGYLHVLDPNVFSRVSDTIFVINFQNFPLRDRYFESLDRIDLTPLGLDHNEQNPRRIDDAELHSDAVLTKYATLSQSFLVFLSNEDLFLRRDAMRRTLIPNNYIAYKEPQYPMIGGVGRLLDYWSQKAPFEDRWAISLDDGIRNNYEFNTTLAQNIVCIDDGRTPEDPVEWSRTQWLMMGADFLNQSS